MSKTAKTIAEEVLTPARVRDLWTANYLPALPFTPQNFDIGTLLPAMLYMARWGQRRGKGAFKNAYGVSGNGKAVPPTIENVASGLLAPRSPNDRKRAPYECGIIPAKETPERFPVRFFLIAMIFIVFDIEIIFFYPWAIAHKEVG